MFLLLVKDSEKDHTYTHTRNSGHTHTFFDKEENELTEVYFVFFSLVHILLAVIMPCLKKNKQMHTTDSKHMVKLHDSHDPLLKQRLHMKRYNITN